MSWTTRQTALIVAYNEKQKKQLYM